MRCGCGGAGVAMVVRMTKDGQRVVDRKGRQSGLK